MKKLVLLAFSAGLFTINASAQSTIPAKNAGQHIGQQVTVVDNVYDVKFYNDSTAIIDFGGKDTEAPLSVVLKFKLNNHFLKYHKQAKLAVTGAIISVANQPTMIIKDKENVHLLYNGPHNRFLAFTR